MGYCFYLYTPDLCMRDEGKFVACEQYIFGNSTIHFAPYIGYYERYGDKKYIDLCDQTFLLNEERCKEADEFTKSTFFTDFLKKYDCNGMLIRVA